MMRIFPARVWHVPQLLNILWLHTRAMGETGRSWWTDAHLMAQVVLRGWVRCSQDEAGMAGFIIRDGERIHALYVRPRAQGRGLGRGLLNEAKTNSDRLELWTLERNYIARAFYQAQGFAECDYGTGLGNDEDLPDIHLIWNRRGAP